MSYSTHVILAVRLLTYPIIHFTTKMVGSSVEWKARTYKKDETELVAAACRKFAESALGSLTMGDFSFRF